MSIWDAKTRKWYCDCGCGEEVSFLSDFRPGHHMRMEEHRCRQSEMMTGMYFGEEHRENCRRAALQAHEDDPTLSDRKSEANLGLCFGPPSDETIEKMRRSSREFWDSEQGMEQARINSERQSGVVYSKEECQKWAY